MTSPPALSLADDGVLVNVVCHGSIASLMLERNSPAAGKDAKIRRRSYIDLNPLKRFGEVAELTEAVLYLASASAAYSTGVCPPVDGGRLA